MDVRCVAVTGDRCGEGAAWDDETQRLYWCDINRFLVHRYDPAHGTVRTWTFDEPVVAVIMTRRPGKVLLALAGHLVMWEPDTNRREPLGFRLSNHPAARLNDGRADRAGRVWIGSMQNNVLPDGDMNMAVESNWASPGHGELFRIDRDGAHSVHRRDIGISNTVCWSPDGRTFYFGDSIANEIRAYDFDLEAGTIGRERPFLSGFERGGPDGSAVDADGYLWNCRFGGGCVVRVAPGGSVDRIVEMPCLDVTTCTFGGPDLKTLYITTAGLRHHAGERLAGSLFALDAPVPGLPEGRADL